MVMQMRGIPTPRLIATTSAVGNESLLLSDGSEVGAGAQRSGLGPTWGGGKVGGSTF